MLLNTAHVSPLSIIFHLHLTRRAELAPSVSLLVPRPPPKMARRCFSTPIRQCFSELIEHM